MKLRVNREDLNLTGTQIDALRKTWTPQIGDVVYATETNIAGNIGRIDGIVGDHLFPGTAGWITKNECIPLLDIGQMIELLQNNNGFIKDCDSGEFMRTSNWVILDYLPGVELCDELWQAVKEAL